MEDMDSIEKGDRKEGVRTPATGGAGMQPEKKNAPPAPGGTKKKRKMLKSAININDRFGYRYR